MSHKDSNNNNDNDEDPLCKPELGCGNSITIILTSIILIIMVENGLFYDTLCFHFVNASHYFSWGMCQSNNGIIII